MVRQSREHGHLPPKQNGPGKSLFDRSDASLRSSSYGYRGQGSGLKNREGKRRSGMIIPGREKTKWSQIFNRYILTPSDS